MQQLELSSGHNIPQIALGLWKITDETEFNVMFDAAIASGYRHFDCAQAYHNEQLLGAALKRHSLARSDVFITTKIDIRNFSHKRTRSSFDESLQKLQLEYVDLLLLHFPVPLLRRGAWRALEKIQADGKAKSIGVSNYTVRHLRGMRRYSTVSPSVNQVELHVFLQEPALRRYCADHGIVVEAYSPLAHGRVRDNKAVQSIADKHQKSYAQIMLRWCLQQNLVSLPKSVTPHRLAENINIFDFELDSSDMAVLTTQNKNLRTLFHPSLVP